MNTDCVELQEQSSVTEKPRVGLQDEHEDRSLLLRQHAEEVRSLRKVLDVAERQRLADQTMTRHAEERVRVLQEENERLKRELEEAQSKNVERDLRPDRESRLHAIDAMRKERDDLSSIVEMVGAQMSYVDLAVSRLKDEVVQARQHQNLEPLNPARVLLSKRKSNGESSLLYIDRDNA